jgi:glycosyltransferase involved in cell wall biosynthesis
MHNLRTQEQIIESWGGNLDPVVSISCITYNHELYIRDAIEGFLIQETDFPFEILIHDDASTDGTADIIREYETRYPDIIKPIYQIENQHSKGVKISVTYNYPRVSGAFIAVCEGDDFWTDPKKLQTQVEALDKYPECDITFHPAVAIDPTGTSQTICHYGSRVSVHPAERVIAGGGGYMPTASIVMKSHLIEPLTSFQKRFPGAPVGDAITQAIGSAGGGAIYVPRSASVYRRMVPGSWSARKRAIPGSTSLYFFSIIEMNRNLDAFLEYRYHESFRTKVNTFMTHKMFFNRELSLDDKRKAFVRHRDLFDFSAGFFWKGVLASKRVHRAVVRTVDLFRLVRQAMVTLVRKRTR